MACSGSKRFGCSCGMGDWGDLGLGGFEGEKKSADDVGLQLQCEQENHLEQLVSGTTDLCGFLQDVAAGGRTWWMERARAPRVLRIPR
jgi:hypothetical protein